MAFVFVNEKRRDGFTRKITFPRKHQRYTPQGIVETETVYSI